MKMKMDLSPDKEFGQDCACANIFEEYDRSGMVQLGEALALVQDESGYDSYRSFSLRVYIDYGTSRQVGNHLWSGYDWYIMTLENRTVSKYGHYEVVIGEGPSLDALLAPEYLEHFRIHKPIEWTGSGNGLLGKCFDKYLKKSGAVFW